MESTQTRNKFQIVVHQADYNRVKKALEKSFGSSPEGFRELINAFLQHNSMKPLRQVKHGGSRKRLTSRE